MTNIKKEESCFCHKKTKSLTDKPINIVTLQLIFYYFFTDE